VWDGVVVDVVTGVAIQKLEVHSGWIDAVAFSPEAGIGILL
jgi:hypothetical protein